MFVFLISKPRKPKKNLNFSRETPSLLTPCLCTLERESRGHRSDIRRFQGPLSLRPSVPFRRLERTLGTRLGLDNQFIEYVVHFRSG